MFLVARRVYRLLVPMPLSMLLLALILTGLPMPTGAQTCQPDGDVNQDGSVTSADAVLVIQQLLPDPPLLSDCQQRIADVHPQPTAPDGNLTLSDALCIYRKVSNSPSCLDSPTLQPVTLTTRLDQSITFDLQDGDPLNDRILRQPLQGTATLNADGSVTYSPEPGAVGEDSLEIQVAGSPLVIIIDNDLAYEGQIDGEVGSFDDVEVLLTGDGVLETTSPDSSGRFKFYALPDGDYVVKGVGCGWVSNDTLRARQ